jgi:type III restriction enzyme
MKFVLKDFQLNAISQLKNALQQKTKEIVLKSPTGSGKTIILTSFIDEFVKENVGYCFIWFTPGKGNLEEQSKNKMNFYFPKAKTALLPETLSTGFLEGQTVFINWELVTKKTNNAIAETEKENLQDLIEKAKLNGLKFVIIVDEEHLNQTYKSSDIIHLFNPEKVIRASATPQKYGDAKVIEITDETVIAAGLIKKLIYINEDVESGIDTNSQIEYLISKAIKKQKLLKNEYVKLNKGINPLIVIQMPNKSNEQLQDIETYLASQGITYENKKLAIWLSEKKENIENIEDLDAEPSVIIIKQAIATGWDCTRAHILVKLRYGMGDTFEIQTIGRIRRMPEAKHYDNQLLDVCYLYTFDDKFKEGVKQTFGANAPEVKRLLLKQEHRQFKLVKYYNPSVKAPLDPKIVLECIQTCLMNEYKLEKTEFKENKEKLEAHGYNFDERIVISTQQGKIKTASYDEIKNLNSILNYELLNTHKHGRDFHKCLFDIGTKVSITYDNARLIIFRLFDINTPHKIKLLNLDYKKIYAFVINNVDKLTEDFYKAITDENYRKNIQIKMQNQFNESEFIFPREEIVGFDPLAKFQKVYASNVYEDYPSTVTGRSKPEIKFEKWCENNTNWFYKNGESNIQYFSVVYKDNVGKQRQFYPDYILESKQGKLWIIETKGGANMSGGSEDIDVFSPFKFEALKEYGKKYNIETGFVRFDERSDELLINSINYKKDLKEDEWHLLADDVK